MSFSLRPNETRGPALNATRARQGLRGTHLIWVLVISTFLAAAGLFIAWSLKAPQLAAANADNGGPGKGGKAFSASAPAVPRPAPAHTTP